jgi:hypothetical protein
MFSILSIPFFSKDVGPNMPIKSTSHFFATKALANDFILVQGAPGTGLGSSKKNDTRSALIFLDPLYFKYFSNKLNNVFTLSIVKNFIIGSFS